MKRLMRQISFPGLPKILRNAISIHARIPIFIDIVYPFTVRAPSPNPMSRHFIRMKRMEAFGVVVFVRSRPHRFTHSQSQFQLVDSRTGSASPIKKKRSDLQRTQIAVTGQIVVRLAEQIRLKEVKRGKKNGSTREALLSKNGG